VSREPLRWPAPRARQVGAAGTPSQSRGTARGRQSPWRPPARPQRPARGSGAGRRRSGRGGGGHIGELVQEEGEWALVGLEARALLVAPALDVLRQARAVPLDPLLPAQQQLIPPPARPPRSASPPGAASIAAGRGRDRARAGAKSTFMIRVDRARARTRPPARAGQRARARRMGTRRRFPRAAPPPAARSARGDEQRRGAREAGEAFATAGPRSSRSGGKINFYDQSCFCHDCPSQLREVTGGRGPGARRPRQTSGHRRGRETPECPRGSADGRRRRGRGARRRAGRGRRRRSARGTRPAST